MLAHLFTYYYYNYTSYPSQDCETIFLYNLGDGILFGDFFSEKYPGRQDKLTAFFKKLIYYLHCDM